MATCYTAWNAVHHKELETVQRSLEYHLDVPLHVPIAFGPTSSKCHRQIFVRCAHTSCCIFPYLPGRAHWGAAPRLANTLTNPAATDPGHRQRAAGNQKAMSAGSLRVATYMQEHPDDAAEIRDELKFWNEVMDHQVPMTKERAEATLPFLTALKWGPLFTNTSPIMFCPPGLDPLDVRCSFPTAEPSSHLHAARTADEHRPGQPANLVRPDPNPAFSLAQPCPPLNSLVFPIRHWLVSHTDTAWAPPIKPSPTPTDDDANKSIPMCPTAAPKTNPLVARHNRFTNRNTADMTAHAAIQPKPHLFPIRHWLPSPNDTAWTPRPNMTLPKSSPTPTDVHTDYSKSLCPPAAHLTDPPSNRFTGLNNTDMTAHAAIQPKPHLFPIRHWLPSPNDTAWTPRPNMTLPRPLPTPTDVKTDYSKPLCPTIPHLPGARVPVPYSIHDILNIDRGHGMAKKLAIYNHVVDRTLKPPTAHRNHHSLSTSRSPTPSGLLQLGDITAVSAHNKLRPIHLVGPRRPPCKPIYRTRRQ
ncbi:hypothetical protein DYB28_012283 [Aphanomyces astaci]|uniref:Uncharacterized protein n=2 Tax=Aphanomyces astaci TaxID=112090 RepID=A0A9X8E947_APHAT|nr:hypothetical protein DYB28_012285 [Aphanomyces astaci]RLO10822.1 hypothetical protein DYB28_012286 [Aphanomyces astaci]RLO11386.1 hypothetical protein DYB28_012283 [Aphanomyces astaci]